MQRGANGEIKIEGRFAESETVNAEAMAKMSALLQGEMLGQTGNGGESTLITAMRQLRIDHDEEFGLSCGLKLIYFRQDGLLCDLSEVLKSLSAVVVGRFP